MDRKEAVIIAKRWSRIPKDLDPRLCGVRGGTAIGDRVVVVDENADGIMWARLLRTGATTVFHRDELAEA